MRTGDGRWRFCWASRAAAFLALSAGCGPERGRSPSEEPAPLDEPSKPGAFDAPQPNSIAGLPMHLPSGGQSGTEDGEAAPAVCVLPEYDRGGAALDAEQYAWQLGATPLEVALQVLGTQSAGSGVDSVVLELNEFLGARTTGQPFPCYPVLFDFRGRAFVGERLLVDGTITLTAANGPRIVDWAYVRAEGAGLFFGGLTLALNGSGVIAREASLHHPDAPDVFVGESEREVAARRRRAPELEQACAAVRGTALDSANFLSFASETEAVAALEGTWVTCDGTENDTLAGMAIHDGHWHDLVRSGDGFGAQRGFGHEGRVEVVSFSAPDDPQSLRYSVFTRGLAVFPEGLRGSSVPFLWTTSLIHIPVDVSEPTLPEAPDGRAGESACASGEAGLLEVTSSDADPALPFVGRWQRCSGPFHERLEFDAQGRVRVLAESGEVLEESELEFQTTFPEGPSREMVFTWWLNHFQGQYTAVFSETPRKLWLGTSDRVGSNYRYESFFGVYSALP